MKRLFCLLIMCIFIFTFNNAFAQTTVLTMSSDNIEDNNVKVAVSNMQIKQENELYCIYINEVKMASSLLTNEKMTFDFSYNGYNYDVECNINDGSVILTYQQLYAGVENCYIQLSTINGIHTIKVFADLTSNECIVLEGTKNGSYIDFNDTYLTYKDGNSRISVHLSFFLNCLTNNLIVTKNGTTYQIPVDKTKQNQYVFVEKHVLGHVCESDYLPKYKATNYSTAQILRYTDEEINRAVSNEPITLVSTKTGLTHDTTIVKSIHYLKRVALEEYETDYDFTVEVAAHYEDEICYEFHDEDKTYSVFGSSFYILKPIEQTITETILDYSDLKKSEWMNEIDYQSDTREKYNVTEKTMYTYKTYSDWSSYAYSKNEVKENDLTDIIKQYKYRVGKYQAFSLYTTNKDDLLKCQNTLYCRWDIRDAVYKSTIKWLEYSDYIYDDYRKCENDSNCQYISKTMYARSVAIWSELSDYIYTDSSQEYRSCKNDQDCLTIKKEEYAKAVGKLSGKYSSWIKTCSNDEDYRCETYYKYTCKSLLIPWTVYSNNSYSIGSTGVCPSGTKITAKESGYRKAYLTFASLTDADYSLTSCQAEPGYTKCFAKSFYAIKTRRWTQYSDYIYTSGNPSDGDVRYKSKIMYSYRYYGWSDYEYDLDGDCQNNETTKCKTQQEYSTDYITWTDYSDWRNRLPQEEFIEYVTRYKYRTRAYLGIGISDTKPDDKDLVSVDTYYQFDYPNSKTIVYKEYIADQQPLGNIEHVNDSDIKLLANNTAINRIKAQYIIDNGGRMNEEEFNAIQISNEDLGLYQSEYNRILNDSIYLPDIYIKTHYRAKRVLFEVDVFNANKVINIEKSKSEKKTIVTSLEEKEGQKDNLVVYYNPQNPLDKYKTIPSNWIGQEELVEQIKHALNTVPTYKVKLTKKEIIELRK